MCVAPSPRLRWVAGLLLPALVEVLVPSLRAQSFVTLPDLPTGRSQAAATVGKTIYGNSRIFVMGGVDAGNQMMDTNESFDPVNDAWYTRAPLPRANAKTAWARARDGSGHFKIFLFGGLESRPGYGLVGSNQVEAYDSKADSWAPSGSLAAMPMACYDAAAATALDGRIYVFGGTYDTQQVFSVVQVYDPVINSWSLLPAMPVPRTRHAAVTACDGLIYLIGGAVAGGQAGLPLVHSFNPRTGSWDLNHPDMPTSRIDFGAAVGRDGLIYVMGGNDCTDDTNVIESYDPVSRQWAGSSFSLSVSRSGLACVVLADRVYALGGDHKPPGASLRNWNEAIEGLAENVNCHGIVPVIHGSFFHGSVGVMHTHRGDIQILEAKPGREWVGFTIIALGSITGTEPGIPWEGGVVPLVQDVYFWRSLRHPEPFLSGSVGVVDQNGGHTMTFTIPPGSDRLSGMTVNHAYVIIDQRGRIVASSNPVSVELVD